MTTVKKQLGTANNDLKKSQSQKTKLYVKRRYQHLGRQATYIPVFQDHLTRSKRWNEMGLGTWVPMRGLSFISSLVKGS